MIGYCRKCGLRRSTPVYARFTIGLECRGRMSGFMAVLFISGGDSGFMVALGGDLCPGGVGEGPEASALHRISQVCHKCVISLMPGCPACLMYVGFRAGK